MKHPSQEELMGLLYHELASDRQMELARHLEECAACRAQMESWQTVRRELAAWQVTGRPASLASSARGATWAGWMKWAVAAVVLAGAGFGLARVTAPPGVDAESLRVALRHELRQEMRVQMEQLDAAQAARHQAFQETFTRTLGSLEAQRLIDYATLRQDMETVAVVAQDGLQTTRRDLARLVNLEGAPPNN